MRCGQDASDSDADLWKFIFAVGRLAKKREELREAV